MFKNQNEGATLSATIASLNLALQLFLLSKKKLSASPPETWKLFMIWMSKVCVWEGDEASEIGKHCTCSC